MSEQMNETARFQACWDNDSIMHICGDHDRCEDHADGPEGHEEAARPGEGTL